MHKITLSLPEEILSALNLPLESLENEMRLAAAIKFYELGRLSSGMAAKFAGTSRVVFLSKLADYDVDTFRLTEAELLEDLTNG